MTEAERLESVAKLVTITHRPYANILTVIAEEAERFAANLRQRIAELPPDRPVTQEDMVTWKSDGEERSIPARWIGEKEEAAINQWTMEELRKMGE